MWIAETSKIRWSPNRFVSNFVNCIQCNTPIPSDATSCPACAKPTSPLESVNEALGGRYQVTSQIGKGAYGEVYKAQDVLLNRTVAIKRVRLDWLGDGAQAKEVQRRFIQEAQVAAQLHHPGIVTVYDVVSAEKTSYIVMEFVEGTTLSAKLAGKKPLPLTETVYILSRVARALHHAHSQGVVHRDVKPANILVSRDGDVKVADFGIAKVESSGEMTRAGVILGTPDYMSPEQATGGVLDGRSDLFSVGCILYECLTGEAPFRAQSLTGVLIRIVNDEPSPVDAASRGLPVELDSVLEHVLAKDPEWRYANGDELANALTSIPGADASKAAPVVGSVGPAGDAPASPEPGSDTGTPDSVADSLMREARRTTRIEPHLHAFREEKRKLRLAGSALLQFRNVSLTPEEAYILSRVQDNVLPRDIFVVSPLTETETARTLLGFLRTGLVAFVEDTHAAEEVTDRLLAKTSAVEHLYDEAQGKDDWQVLGLEKNATPPDIKRAFQALAFQFHPDRYAQIEDAEFQKKVSWLFLRVSDAFATLSSSQSAGASP